MLLSFMASKNFCDICDKPAVKVPEPVEMMAHTLNETTCPKYHNNKVRFTISWSIQNTYTDNVTNGHVCKDCLIAALQQHIKNLQAQA